ncbi:MAG: type IV pilin, partial [Thermoplasmata archaeon]|nr:type IV pilin [Thermoplasmata archaeon]
MKIYRKEKGVSEVLGSILILLITVVLFSSVFYYVSTMPTPKSQ